MTQQPRRSPLEPPKNSGKPQRRKALGPLSTWTDAKIDEMSLINDADIAEALKLWEAEAPMPLKGLLQAKTEEKK